VLQIYFYQPSFAGIAPSRFIGLVLNLGFSPALALARKRGGSLSLPWLIKFFCIFYNTTRQRLQGFFCCKGSNEIVSQKSCGKPQAFNLNLFTYVTRRSGTTCQRRPTGAICWMPLSTDFRLIRRKKRTSQANNGNTKTVPIVSAGHIIR